MHDSYRVSHKYSENYAEPERAIAEDIDEVYGRAVVIPAYREVASRLWGYEAAVRAAPGRTLLVVVANAADDASADAHRENEEFLRELRDGSGRTRQLSGPRRAWLVEQERFDILVIDRASPGQRLPPKQGVGLARKIGCDLALELHLHGKLLSPWIHSTDADVTVSPDYLVQTEPAGGQEPGERSYVALLFPYRHVPCGEADLDRATALYEVGLRYYVLGLAYARSSYAFHTIGSTLAVHATAYAQVRGFPRRLAGEDFYLLDKLAKVGPIRRAHGGMVQITARWSDRTPFGTGRGVRRIAERWSEGNDAVFYDPRLFDALRACLAGFEAYCRDGGIEALAAELDSLPRDLCDAVASHLAEERVADALAVAARESPDRERLRRRVLTWFDGLKTLKLLHAVREATAPDVPWRAALGSAPFCRGLPPADDPAALCDPLWQRERELPALVGPTTAQWA